MCKRAREAFRVRHECAHCLASKLTVLGALFLYTMNKCQRILPLLLSRPEDGAFRAGGWYCRNRLHCSKTLP